MASGEPGLVRPFVVHAHCFQPDRANPWTGAVDRHPGAEPDHDWNARILREVYRPCAAGRLYDAQGRVERIVNAYERVSFDFGPALLQWMERTHPDTYARVLDADWRSAVRLGHGNAVAQAYHHAILPLASARDRHTEIRWGQADFRARFGREPEGMWLPETAVDRATVYALIEAGIRFTVLSASQAGRVRAAGGPWRPGDDLDPGRPYRHMHSDGSGRSLAVFFSDDTLSNRLAFDDSADQAAAILDALQAGRRDGLEQAAVHGETFGHHHPGADVALARVLHVDAEPAGPRPTNYAAWLAEHPADDEVEVAEGEGTSWSCPHGVSRWYRDCGCAAGGEPGWTQAWRVPLRAAIDRVRDAAAEALVQQGDDLLRRPWAARDDYVGVLLGTVERADFLERHALRGLDDERHSDLWALLEAQRHALAVRQLGLVLRRRQRRPHRRHLAPRRSGVGTARIRRGRQGRGGRSVGAVGDRPEQRDRCDVWRGRVAGTGRTRGGRAEAHRGPPDAPRPGACVAGPPAHRRSRGDRQRPAQRGPGA